MNKLTISLTICAMALAGCGDDDRPGDIVIPDSGPGADMGPGGSDLGPGTDSGPTGPRDCEQPVTDLVDINMDPMVMGMLLPRCELATETCVGDCADDLMCQSDCVDADTTPGVDVGGGTVLDCSLCFNYQFNVCVYEACPDQWETLFCCAEDAGCMNPFDCAACGTELSGLQTCFQGSGANCSTYQSACFADE